MDIGEHGIIPPDQGDPVPRLVLEPEGDEEDGIELIFPLDDDEWGVDDDLESLEG